MPQTKEGAQLKMPEEKEKAELNTLASVESA
jgi:hypothetical protein